MTHDPGDPHAPAHKAGPDASLYLHPQTLARLGSFELRAKHIVEGVMSGQHRSPYTGYSVEFAQHRPYSPGDDIRHLDWKVYARTDRLQIKQYQQETNLDLVVLVDASGSMAYGSRLFKDASGTGQDRSQDRSGQKTSGPNTAGPYTSSQWTKFDHATALAAALSYVTLQQGDRVGLATFTTKLDAIMNRSSQRGTWRKIIDILAGQAASSGPNQETDIGRVIDLALAEISGKCLIAVVSDFFEPTETIHKALARVRHRGHDLIAFQVLDRAERTFDFADAAPFEGLEGEGLVKVSPRAIRKGYLEAMEAHIDGVHRACRGFGFDHEVVDTHDWLGPPLAAFAARREAQLKRSKYG